MKLEADSAATPQRSGTPRPSGTPQPSRCVASEGKFAGGTWDTLNDYVLQQELATNADRELEALAKAFGLQGQLTSAPESRSREVEEEVRRQLEREGRGYSPWSGADGS